MDWRDKLKKEIDAITDDQFVDGVAMVFIEVATSTAEALLPFRGRVNETPLSGAPRGKVILAGMASHTEGSPHGQRINRVYFEIRDKHPFNAFITKDGESVQLIDRNGQPLYPYVDFNSV